MTSILTVLLVTTCVRFAHSACTTPKGAEGVCKPVRQCEPLMTLLRKSDITTEDIDLLKKSACGFQDNEPKVCCPSDDNCTTPDGKKGKCISLYTCPHLMDMLKEPISEKSRKFVNDSRCEGTYKYNICCGPPPKTQTNADKSCTPTALLPTKPGCCGVDVAANDKIIGGEFAQIDEFPWMVVIEYVKGKRKELLCGGALISGKYVLTAGHCVVGDILYVGNPRSVRLGEYDTSNSINELDCVETAGGGLDCNEGVIRIPIERITAHPDYNPFDPLKRADIALIRLTQLAPYTDFIRPICLPSADHSLTKPEPWTSQRITMIVAGWGLFDDKQRSYLKRYVELPIVNREVCQRAYKKLNDSMTLWKGQICAGGEEKKDSCKGDSGGPLMYRTLSSDRRNTFELSGVVNFGTTPCGMKVPGVYTNVFEYNAWIRNEIKAC